jgi:hypothetical protein
MGTGDVQHWSFFGVTQIQKVQKRNATSILAKEEPVMKDMVKYNVMIQHVCE